MDDWKSILNADPTNWLLEEERAVLCVNLSAADRPLC